MQGKNIVINIAIAIAKVTTFQKTAKRTIYFTTKHKKIMKLTKQQLHSLRDNALQLQDNFDEQYEQLKGEGIYALEDVRMRMLVALNDWYELIDKQIQKAL